MALIWLVWLGCLYGQTAGNEDPVEVLMTLRDQVTANGEGLPNYACVESIRRERFEPMGSRPSRTCAVLIDEQRHAATSALMRLVTTDWLRLDVALFSNREMFSWAGANRFEEGEIDELIPQGAMGTGAYAGVLLSLFANRAPRFVFEGETTVEGKRAFEYSYTVSQEQSRYRIKAGKDWLITGYSGTMMVEPKTAKLIRLLIQTDELPVASQTCETHTTLEYEAVRLGNENYLLPKMARQRFLGRDGSEAENQMSFARCRQFGSESKLAFGPVAGGAEKAAEKARELPAGLAVTVELMTSVRVGEAAAGDRIEGRLKNAIRDETQKALAPEGSMVEGRLMRVDTVHPSPGGHTIALRWEAVKVDGVVTPLRLSPNRRATAPAGGRVNGAPGLRTRGVEIELPLPGERRYAVVRLAQEHPVLESGHVSEWLTIQPNDTSGQER